MDLSDLEHYYQLHHRLMKHWLSVLPPGTIMEVPYEGLVADQTAWTRKMLEFIGLDWDERCLDFHSSPRGVATASAWQVRQKIYATSVERWRHYEKFIGPLMGLQKARRLIRHYNRRPAPSRGRPHGRRCECDAMIYHISVSTQGGVRG